MIILDEMKSLLNRVVPSLYDICQARGSTTISALLQSSFFPFFLVHAVNQYTRRGQVILQLRLDIQYDVRQISMQCWWPSNVKQWYVSRRTQSLQYLMKLLYKAMSSSSGPEPLLNPLILRIQRKDSPGSPLDFRQRSNLGTINTTLQIGSRHAKHCFLK